MPSQLYLKQYEGYGEKIKVVEIVQFIKESRFQSIDGRYSLELERIEDNFCVEYFRVITN